MSCREVYDEEGFWVSGNKYEQGKQGAVTLTTKSLTGEFEAKEEEEGGVNKKTNLNLASACGRPS